MKYFFSLFVIASITLSCIQSNSEKSHFLFNEGVSLSLNATNELQKGNIEKHETLNKMAIKKFIEVLSIDSLHKLAPSALGHCNYEIKKFKEGVQWFQKAIKTDSTLAVNYRELGLCKINLGEFDASQEAFRKAFELDKSQEIKEVTISDLQQISSLAFDYSKTYIKQGEEEKGIQYKQFSVGVLFIAHSIDSTNISTLTEIANFTSLLGDTVTSNIYTQKKRALTQK
jgi:tetratricopeptide (TPR) repeat protein|tara:strand:+ start:765 stop:1448 length:684 start_codon:yes stop_codon:yes gene_type:complete